MQKMCTEKCLVKKFNISFKVCLNSTINVYHKKEGSNHEQIRWFCQNVCMCGEPFSPSWFVYWSSLFSSRPGGRFSGSLYSYSQTVLQIVQRDFGQSYQKTLLINGACKFKPEPDREKYLTFYSKTYSEIVGATPGCRPSFQFQHGHILTYWITKLCSVFHYNFNPNMVLF